MLSSRILLTYSGKSFLSDRIRSSGIAKPRMSEQGAAPDRYSAALRGAADARAVSLNDNQNVKK